jgi:aryl carrier-like protein
MDCFAKGQFRPIRVDKVFEAPAVLEAFRYMQQGKHIGKIVLEIRDATGKLLVQDVDTTKKAGAQLDGAASYLLIGGLGGLGRSMSLWMVEHGAKNLTFLSRSAGSANHADFVREIQSMGCTVQLVQGDVTSPEDVARAVEASPAPLKGIVQMSMVLRDQMFEGMNIEDWNAVTQPKVQGTWNLHKVALSKDLALDFFLLFSSLSGILGQVGQANYASANTFLDAFVQYRANMNLPCTAIDLGAMEGIGYLSENQDLLKKMQGTGWRAVQETELLGALNLAMMSPETRSRRGTATAAGDAFLLGLSPTIPLSSPESSARLRRDVRMAVYHNMGTGANKTGTATDGLRAFLSTAKKDPSLLRSKDTSEFLGLEIGKKLCSLVLATDAELDISMRAADIGLDSLVAVELQAWWKLNFGFDISTLEMLSMGTLEALGKRAADGLIALYDA